AVKYPEHLRRLRAIFSLQFHCHQRSRGLADGTAVSGKLDILQAAVGVEFHSKMDLVTAGRIIAVHQDGGIGQLTKIPRPSRMIEDYSLVKLFQFRVHEKKRTAWLRISIIR